MRLRTLLATAVAGTLLAGAAGVPAQANRAPSPGRPSGAVVAWGASDNPLAAGAMDVPIALTAPVADIASSFGAIAAVTADGHLKVWGSGAEVDEAPTDVTNAVAVALTIDNGAVLRADGTVTAWGFSDDIVAVPAGLRAKAIALSSAGIGYAVRTDGTLMTWGAEPAAPTPSGLTNLVDVSVGLQGQVLALKSDGTAVAWAPDPTDPVATIPDLGGRKVTQIVAGAAANGLLLNDGTIKVWGPVTPPHQPSFAGKKVVFLALGAHPAFAMAGAVTEDGAVHTWGADAAVNVEPSELDGQPVTALALGMEHAAVIVGSLQDVSKPTIAGTPQVGQTLTATPSTFNVRTEGPATGQWYADAVPIAGQTGTTLALGQAVVGKKLSYRSTASRGGKTVTSASNEVGPVTAVAVPPPAAAKSTVTAKVKAAGKTKKVAKKVTITVTVKTTAGASVAGKVTVTLTGKTRKKVTATVNAAGKATVTVKNVKRGRYQAQLSYAGNAGVAASQATTKFKV